jgi:Asp-tRNA(Asn)/Glu-tRNA(Gln) amidotransferase A subunit family amidase
MTELSYITATEALELFRGRELSPVELIEATIAQAERVEPVVNALCHQFFDEALTQARAAEQRYAGKGEPPRPLEGIPLAIKEEEPVAGQPLTQGSLIYKDQIAEHSSAFAQRQLDSGAIVHARTTAPEFSCSGFTQSRIWGVTRNPWNPTFSPGGSSGGSAAALASGTTTLASGSDIGGSIRIPASFCGVVGFKPPYGRVPVEPPFNLDTFCHNGPLARTVADCALYQNQIAGPDRSDITTLRPKLTLPHQFEGISGMRIALSVDLGGWVVDPQVRANTLAVGDALREAGAIVEEVDIALSQLDVARAGAIHFRLIFGDWVAQTIEANRDLVTDYAVEFARWSAEASGDGSLLEALTLEAQIYEPVADLLDRYEALVCPTNGMSGLLADDDYVGHGITVDGTELQYYFDALLTSVFNVLSRCPVLNVPSGFSDNGVPTGVQIAGRSYDDETVFRIGSALEAVRPWLDTPERRPKLDL